MKECFYMRTATSAKEIRRSRWKALDISQVSALGR